MECSLMLDRDGTSSRVVSSIDTTTPTRGGGTPRGQSTIELITIVAVAIIILAVLVDFTANQVDYLQKQQAVKTAELAIQSLVSTADVLYTQGVGATRYVQLTWPYGVESNGTGIQNHSIVVNVYGTTVSGTAIPSLTGTLPINSGLQNIRVRAFDGFVMIGEMDVSASPTSITSTLARSSFADTNVVLTSSATEDATISITKSWSHADINLNITPSSGTLSAGSTFSFDANLLTNASAVGSYTGTITVTATFPSTVQTLVIPVQANVNAGNSSLLVAFPSSISLSTFGIDTNSTTFQVCNVGSTEMKNITITPSSGAPGTWLAPFTPINSISAQSCQTIDVNVSVPTDSISPYTGSLTISDYTGANTISMPVTINVRGMNSVFRWNWGPAYKSVQSIFDFELANVGRKPVTITQVTLRDWWDCDQQLSLWNSLVINNTSRFIGSLPDGNTANVTDFNLPVLTTFTDNYMSFSDNIQDDNEAFTAVVDFSDGTQFTSATFSTDSSGTPLPSGGSNCPVDTTPPGRVTDLAASPGPEPGSIRLTFTYPGDDNFTGRASIGTIKSSYFRSITTGADWNAATTVATIPGVTAGTQGSVVITGLRVGLPQYFAIAFEDEVPNQGTISNSPGGKPWAQFNFAGNDFNFANAPSSYLGTPPIGTWDINRFFLHNISLSGGSNHGILIFRVEYDGNTTNRFVMRLDFNATDVNYYAIWYPAPRNYLGATPNSDANLNATPYSAGVELSEGPDFDQSTDYGSPNTEMQYTNRFYLDYVSGISDFNMFFDMFGVGEELYEP